MFMISKQCTVCFKVYDIQEVKEEAYNEVAVKVFPGSAPANDKIDFNKYSSLEGNKACVVDGVCEICELLPPALA